MTQPAPAPVPPAAEHPRIDPARSACVLIGVDAYTSPSLEVLDSVRHNRSRLREMLLDRGVGGFSPGRVLTEPNPATARHLTRAIEKAGERAEDTLVVYYAGHGLLGPDNRLFLTLPDSELGRPETWVDTRHVQSAIKRSDAQRIVLVLDCCYSGQWGLDGEMGVGHGVDLAVRTLEGLRGSYVMASAPHNRTSHAPDPDRCSVFTGALVDVMSEGDPAGGEFLSLGDLFQHVRRRVRQVDLPEVPDPQSRDENGLAALGFVRNAALQPPLSPHLPLVPRRRRPARVLSVGLAVGLAAGLAAGPVWEWAQGRKHTEARGDCSSRAALLDHSDALDRQHEVNNEPIAGLSGLAHIPGQYETVYAVADNAPGRIFPVVTGDARHLAPRAQTGKTLRQKDGSSISRWFDGEALAVEKGGETVLVASETGPAIRRFHLRTGRQQSELPLPQDFRVWPDGGAQTGRTIESLTLSPDGRHLYAGLEAPLSQDGDERGRGLLRIQRYVGTPGGTYTLDRQFAYRTDVGLSLVELVAVDNDDRLLALERHYSVGLGNAIRVKELTLTGAANVADEPSLFEMPADVFVRSSLLFDLARCPAGSPGEVAVQGGQANPLLGNVEGMALGGTVPSQ